MFVTEFAKSIQDMLFDGLSGLLEVCSRVRDYGGREVGTVDRVVNRNRNFELGVVIDWIAGNTSPHWLQRSSGCEYEREMVTDGQTGV